MDPQESRAQSSDSRKTVVLEEGSPGGAVLIVLDHAGVAGDQLPATWDLLSARSRVVWFDASTLDDPLVDARIVLDRQAARQAEIYLVADRDGEQLASLVAAHRPAAVSAVLLVEGDVHAARLPFAQPELHRFLAEQGVVERILASEHGTDVGVDHPSVVDAINRELWELGATMPSPATDDHHTALRHERVP